MISLEQASPIERFCRVCGDVVIYASADEAPASNRTRCSRHERSHACAIEGCRRSTRARDGDLVFNDTWICGDHWRQACPPRSRRRRAYHWFFAEAKRRGGFDDDLNRRFWRFWGTLVGSARRRRDEGSIDVREIHRIMGWD